MGHYAKLNAENIVVFVTVSRNEDDEKELEISARTGDTYRRTSYNTYGGVHQLGGVPFRKNYAGIGYAYDTVRDAFISPKPYPSWVLGEATCLWDAPVPRPATGEWRWDEATLSWIEMTYD